MRSQNQRWKLGQVLKVKVVDCIAADIFIVELNGALVRASNQTNVPLKVGDEVALRVTGIQPLELSLVVEKAFLKEWTI